MRALPGRLDAAWPDRGGALHETDKSTITTDGTLLNAPGTTSTGAITGGTGKFRNARGEAVLDLGPPEGPHRVSFRVIVQP
jgi:hypothetical protein